MYKDSRGIQFSLSMVFVSSLCLFSMAGCKLNDNSLKGQMEGSPSIANIKTCIANTTTTGECKIEMAGVMVTDQFGGNINTWSNGSANTTVSATIPDGYYQNKTVDLSDVNLLAMNILSGVEIFGVTGAMIADSSMSNAHRDQGAAQLTQNEEVSTYAGSGGTPNLPGDYREVPQIALDDDGGDGTNVTFVDRTGWGANACGFSGTMEFRINHCATTFGAEATWNGALKGNAGQGVWKLVSRTGDLAGGMGEEVWKDMRTGLLWSSKVSVSLNWCKASGSNFITNNPSAEDDPSNYCDNATYQVTGTFSAGTNLAISACYEDVDDLGATDYFTTTDGSIDSAGKAGLGYASTPSVRWRLPTVYDYKTADVNGIRFVLPDSDANYEWSASVLTSNRSYAWAFSGAYGTISGNARSSANDVRCVGR